MDMGKAWIAYTPADRLINISIPLNSIQVPLPCSSPLKGPKPRGTQAVRAVLVVRLLISFQLQLTLPTYLKPTTATTTSRHSTRLPFYLPLFTVLSKPDTVI